MAHSVYDHTVLPATHQRWYSHLNPNELTIVLNLTTLEGCKSQLI